MKAFLQFELPEDEAELKISVQAMDLLGSIRDFYERLRTMKKYGHSFETADGAIEGMYQDYCDAMQEWLS